MEYYLLLFNNLLANYLKSVFLGKDMTRVSIRKILQALYYIQSSPLAGNRGCYYMFLLKILYFADRYHLRHYGFIASSDTYVAMKLGPVASTTFDIVRGKMPSSANSAEIGLLNEISASEEYAISIKEQDTDELSESFKEALDFALKEYGQYDQFTLSNMTHDYPEWKEQKRFLGNGVNQVPMNIPSFFDNPQKLEYSEIDPYADDDPELLACFKEDFSNATSC